MNTLTDATMEPFLAESDRPVVVDFWAAWCGPCRALAPVVEQLAADRPDLHVAKLDIDANPRMAGAFNVMSIPTLIVFVDGLPVGSIVGLKDKAGLVADLDALLSRAAA